jgi:hypothetical protein
MIHLKFYLICVLLLTSLGFSKKNKEIKVFSSWGAGYTHYEASELNELMSLFAKRASDSAAGFNNFETGNFTGHPYQVFEVGVEWKDFAISIEVDWWVESFEQKNIPFYTERANDSSLSKSDKITCQWIQDRNSQNLLHDESIAGCINAEESFTFLPITLNLSYLYELGDFRFKPGYGIGVMGGKSSITMNTKYYHGYDTDDNLELEIWPGVNLLQKVWLDIEYKPWDHFGLLFKSGWRFSELQKLELSKVSGRSEILNLAFGKEISEGDQFYVESFRNLPDSENELSLTKEDDFVKNEKYYNSVQGDFDGWFIALKLNYYWF